MELQIGKIVTYHPIRENKEDNRHWPATIVKIGKRITICVMDGAILGPRVRVVSKARLSDQGELPL